MKKEFVRCSAVLRDLQCEKEQSHPFKHRNQGVSWTDQGAQRIAAEEAEAVAKTAKKA